jgi:hypothetical protein
MLRPIGPTGEGGLNIDSLLSALATGPHLPVKW